MAGRFLRSQSLGLVWLDEATVAGLARELADDLAADHAKTVGVLHRLTVETDLGPAVLTREIDRALTGARS